MDFLPFPDRFKAKGTDPARKSRMSPRTHEIFHTLLRQGKIPTDVAVAFSDELGG